jgi:hypothetical protein
LYRCAPCLLAALPVCLWIDRAVPAAGAKELGFFSSRLRWVEWRVGRENLITFSLFPEFLCVASPVRKGGRGAVGSFVPGINDDDDCGGDSDDER